MRALLVALATLISQAPAATGLPIEPLAGERGERESGCRFFLMSAPGGRGAPVLEWTGANAKVHLNGQFVQLEAREARCEANCTAPGKAGVRMVHLRGVDVAATLRVDSVCPAIAEACAGLLAGAGQLVVDTAGNRIAIPVWHDDCDQ